MLAAGERPSIKVERKWNEKKVRIENPRNMQCDTGQVKRGQFKI